MDAVVGIGSSFGCRLSRVFTRLAQSPSPYQITETKMGLQPLRSTSRSSWLTFPVSNSQASLRLFCFHYAGGGAWIFNTWPNTLTAAVEVCSIELPGRGRRIREAP